VDIILYNVVIQTHAHTIGQSVARVSTIKAFTRAVLTQITVISTCFAHPRIILELTIYTGAVIGGVHGESQLAGGAGASEIIDVCVTLRAIGGAVGHHICSGVVLGGRGEGDVDALV
jgi:hypothetical protein